MIALKLAVIGDPVAHSKSPDLHRGFLAAADMIGTYEAIRVEAGDGARMIRNLGGAGYHGLNVTTPLKEEAWRTCTSYDATALATGSVNTIVFGKDDIVGCNTDGIGLVAALRRACDDAALAGMHVLLLGAGPTARAGAYALAADGVRLSFWNRTPERASDLVRRYGGALLAPDDCPTVAISTLPPNADLPPEVRATLADADLVLDANYGPRATLETALGRAVIDGFGMLEAQAAASFSIWRRRFATA